MVCYVKEVLFVVGKASRECVLQGGLRKASLLPLLIVWVCCGCSFLQKFVGMDATYGIGDALDVTGGNSR